MGLTRKRASKFDPSCDLHCPTLRLAGSNKQRTGDSAASYRTKPVLSLLEECTEVDFPELFQLHRDKEGLGGLLIGISRLVFQPNIGREQKSISLVS